MKKALPKKTGNTTFLVIAFFVSIISLMQPGCKAIKSWREYISKEGGYKHIPPDTSQQIVVWKTPGSDPTYLNSWLDSIETHCGPLQITFFCGSCDSSLMLLSGTGIRTFIQSGSKGGGTTCTVNCPPTGGGDTIYWSVNFPVDLNDSTYEDPNGIHVDRQPGTFRDTSVTVAVFDTGIEPPNDMRKENMYSSDIPSCLDPRATNGWNFPDANNVTVDDYHLPKGHGAIVSRLIIDQVYQYQENKVKILPVKIHNANGQSDLFSVLCGFAYAKERGAQIINASFGYYALKNTGTGMEGTDAGALLLKKYIQYYLTRNNILLIAAAGNESSMEATVFTNAGLPVPADLRSLDNVAFYPASLASDPDLPNVIAVTTVNDADNTVSPHQNYSPTIVDIGVNADQVLSDHYYFRNPRVNRGLSEGSSFATPIVSGIICAHYSLIKNHLSAAGLEFNKANILGFLLQMPVGHHNTGLDTKIKTGVMFNTIPH